ncbi:MAG TPA: hypothetical protein VK427_14455 [Kofleriaceae bacterium]|nr:hypothetical protein [Kofleriaceae bacterium]
MRLRHLVRKLKIALAGLVGGLAFACSGPANPGEMPPMAPRPDPVQPSSAPLPGAGDPLGRPDAGLVTPTEVPTPSFRSSGETIPAQRGPGDAGVQDAVALPPVPDALPPDAKRTEPASTCC